MGDPRRIRSLLPVQPVVLFTCGGRVLLTLSALRAHTTVPYKTDLHRETLRALKRLGGPGQGPVPVRFISSLFYVSICIGDMSNACFCTGAQGAYGKKYAPAAGKKYYGLYRQ